MKNRTLILISALACGFLGGAIANAIVASPVFAHDVPVERIIAQEFVLVDADGKVLGRFGKGADGGSLALLDSKGAVVWSQPQPLVRPLQSGATPR